MHGSSSTLLPDEHLPSSFPAASLLARPHPRTPAPHAQCEQTRGGVGCTTIGVCGKTSQVASLQDLLIFQLKGLGAWANFAHQQAPQLATPEVDSFVKAAVFATLTNVRCAALCML